ncbi:NudC domain-containing protein 2 [Perkinsus olseni]|uniref:NudC domain-containing protein 2 n=2 Tax=Perkinsus olseni TaxID=32597 RepID=A0A7J6MAK1_PEROL|nr:NudC domain-containing protein 2 [Perkinsus olseni]
MVGRDDKDPKVRELEKKARGRQPYIYEGHVVYEWEQTQDEVHIYVKLPPGCTKASQLSILLDPKRVKLSLRGANQFYLNHEPAGLVDKDDSTWFIEDGEVHIILAKARKAELWPSCFEGQAQLDAFTQNELSKKLMLERFQEENPGFDFSGAEFNGSVPNAREFMGGVKYK